MTFKVPQGVELYSPMGSMVALWTLLFCTSHMLVMWDYHQQWRLADTDQFNHVKHWNNYTQAVQWLARPSESPVCTQGPLKSSQDALVNKGLIMPNAAGNLQDPCIRQAESLFSTLIIKTFWKSPLASKFPKHTFCLNPFGLCLCCFFADNFHSGSISPLETHVQI